MCSICNNNKCQGCNQTVYQSVHICAECPPEDCSCPILDLSTDCVLYNQDDIKDGAITVVPKNTILSNALQLIVEYINTKFSSISSYFTLVNTGTGADIYSGINLLGEKKIRRLKSSDASITITEGTDDIDLVSVGGSNTLDEVLTAGNDTTQQAIFNGSTVVTAIGGDGLYMQDVDDDSKAVLSPNVLQFSDVDGDLDYGIGKEGVLFYHDNSNLSALQNNPASTGSFSTVLMPIMANGETKTLATLSDIDGSETKLTAGTNVTITGSGTISTPYVINSTASGGSVVDATPTVKGILKLAGDLGGTADVPTTPTALHKSGDENFSGNKYGTNGSGKQVSLLDPQGSVVASSSDSSTAPAFYGFTDDIQPVFVSVSPIGSSGDLYQGIDNSNTIRYKVDKDCNVTGVSFIKTGGTAQQILLADGGVTDINPQKTIATSYTLTNADNGYTIFVDTSAGAVTVTRDAGITLPNFCVGFVHEGGNNLTFVGATNPIGLKSKGAGYQTFIERKLATSSFFLLGNTQA